MFVIFLFIASHFQNEAKNTHLCKVELSWLMHKCLNEPFSYCCVSVCGMYVVNSVGGNISVQTAVIPVPLPFQVVFLFLLFIPCCYSICWQASFYYSTKKKKHWNTNNSGCTLMISQHEVQITRKKSSTPCVFNM